MSPEFEKQILVAGVGNAWMQDDGFGSEAARRLEGREATVERIYVDVEGRVQLAVTIAGVPGQDIMRDIRRYLFFRPDEVEVV